MAVENNISLCVIFAVLNGLFLSFGSALPAWFAAKDRKTLENTRNQQENNRSEEESKVEKSLEKETEDISEFQQGDLFVEDDLDNVSSLASLSQKEVDDTKEKTKTSPCKWKLIIMASFVISALGNVFAYLALLYGPVSICTPIMSCSLLSFGVIIMSYILKLEDKPNKESRVGYYILLASVIQVVFTGPIVDGETPTLSKEELQAQLLAPTSLSVILVMICVLIMTLPHTFIVLFHKKGANYFSDNINFVVFQVSIVITGSIMASCTKLFPNSEGWLFWANIALFAVSFIICPVVNMCKNIYIKNIATFVAINAALTYLLNAFVGLICWKDQIRNWGGYCISWTLFILGIYLICDVDLLDRIGGQSEDMDLLDEDRDSHHVSVCSIETAFSLVPNFSLAPTSLSPSRYSMAPYSYRATTLSSPKGKRLSVTDDYSC